MAVMDLERRLKGIENELKAMKVCYNTAGSLVAMYVTKMDTFTVEESGWTDVVVRFVPTYGKDQMNLITLTARVGGNTYYVAPYAVNPQDGSGNVEITILSVYTGASVDVIASGTSPGTFVRVT